MWGRKFCLKCVKREALEFLEKSQKALNFLYGKRGSVENR